jgi:hypothetical protein
LTILEDETMNGRKLNWALACILGVMLCTGYTLGVTPQNNSCYYATAIEEVADLAFDTSGATFDGPGLCMTSPNIWYRYTATRTGEVTISLCGSEYDTKLAVYTGTSCYPSSGRLIACNDDSCGWQSEVTVSVIAGNSYLIEIGGYGSHTGQGVLNFIWEEQQYLNDNCQNAQQIGNVTNLPFDTTEATFDGPGLCTHGPNIWYVYTAPCSGQATVSTCGSSFDTVLAVYSGSACNPNSSRLIGCNDDACGHQSELTFNVESGSQYLIEVGGYDNLTGQGILNISCEGGAENLFDLGDAPDSTNDFSTPMYTYPTSVRANFPTVFDNAVPYGPIHLNPSALAFLGNSVTGETEADTGFDQDGFNNISPLTQQANRDGGDNGVSVPLNMPNCQWATFDYTVNVIAPGTDLYVNVWCDWNRDGDWNDDSTTNPSLTCSKGTISEWAVQNQLLFDLPAGLNQLTTPAFLSWHPKSGPQNMWMRITLSEQPWKGGSTAGGSGPQEGYDYGETEDYYFIPETEETSCDMCRDINGDGVVDINDLVTYVNQWLAICQ